MKVPVVAILSTLLCNALAAKILDACNPDSCKIEKNCECSNSSPMLKDLSQQPQLITITFNEALETGTSTKAIKSVVDGRKNPDGAPISGTLYIPHLNTDYTNVHDFYVRGFDIGVHSITNREQEYWRNASVETLTQEFAGQRLIISEFANIAEDDIQGVRTPQLQINGDRTFQAYKNSKLTYDSSWPALEGSEFNPYTLDFPSLQKCATGYKCPVSGFPGFWVMPVLNFKSIVDGGECNVLQSCTRDFNGTQEEIEKWLMDSINKIKSYNKAPITLLITSSWFQFTKGSYEALTYVLDELSKEKDVFFVSHSQVLDYVRKPVPLSEFKTRNDARQRDCEDKTCNVKFGEKDMSFRICTECPKTYPWLGNPEGN